MNIIVRNDSFTTYLTFWTTHWVENRRDHYLHSNMFPFLEHTVGIISNEVTSGSYKSNWIIIIHYFKIMFLKCYGLLNIFIFVI